MGYTLSKQPLSKEIFNDDYNRRIFTGGKFGDILGVRENWHHGVDYGADVGEKLHALESGEVTFVTSTNTQLERDFGRFIGTYYPSWDVTISYSHCSEIIKSVGASVSKKEVIARSGNTGKSTGAHVDVMIASGRCTSLKQVYDRAFDFETYVPSSNSKPIDGKFINLKPLSATPRYGYYKMGVVPVSKNISGYILANELGGVSYEIKRRQSNDVVIVQTRDFGEVQLYVDKTRSTITDSPEYKIYGDVESKPEQPKPEPQPVSDSKVGKVLVVRKSSYKKPTFVAYYDRECTKPVSPWTMANYNHDLTFYIVEDLDPVFKCMQWSLTPMGGVDHVYIKWESGIGFEDA